MGLTPEHIAEPKVAELIRRSARRIVERCHLSGSDYQDVQQDLYLRLVRNAPLYDPRRSARHVFIAIVLRTGALNLIRRYFADRRGCVQLGDDDQELLDERHGDVCLRLDLHRALKALDPAHRALATALQFYKLVPAGRGCGMARGKARAGLTFLRDHFTACGLAPHISELRRAS